MTTAYTSLLGLALPVTGELSGTWGDTVNNSITSLLDTSVAGTTNVSTDTDVTLTTTTGAANTARQAILLFSGARTALRTITAPAQSKIYTVINATTGGFSVKLVGVGPTTGVTIVAGESAVCAWNGSDFVKVSNTGGSASFVNLTASGTVTFTGLTASQAVFTNASDELVSNAITGTGNVVMSASPTLTGTVGGASLTLSSLTSGRVTYAGTSGLLQDDADLTFDGTTLSTAGLTASSTVTLSGGTANGVAYLNGSKVVTSGSALTFSGTNLGVSGNGAFNTGSSGGVVSGSSTYSGYLEALGGASGATIGITPSTISGANGVVYNTSFVSGGSGPHVFQIGGSEQMRLTSTGLGIGTSSPATKLQVNGGYISQSDGTVTTYMGSDGTGSLFGTTTNQYLRFVTNNTERMRLDTSGNLGLGVTPSAWGSAYKAIQFNNGTYGGGSFITDNGSPAITANAYNNSGWKYVNTDYATIYQSRNGQHQWFTAASGTAGNAITFTQAMTLDASGNFMVGTTSATRFIDFEKNQNASTILRIANTTSGTGAYSALQLGSSSPSYLYNFSDAYTTSGIFVAGATVLDAGGTGGLNLNAAAVAIRFYTASAERARIDVNGRMQIGTTSALYSATLSLLSATNSYNITSSRVGAGNGTLGHVVFETDNGAIGTIQTNGSTTSYNTSSDYRLKNITGPITNSGSYIDSLNPVEGTWKADGSVFVGLIAHETQEVSRTSVATGIKDGEEMQGMDYSSAEIIANLIAEIQSLRKRLADAGI